MKTMFKAVPLAAAIALLPMLSPVALAQAPAAAPASAPANAAIADLQSAVRDTAAFRTAAQQVQTQYKPQIDAYKAKLAPYDQELQRLQAELQTLQNTPGTSQQTLQTKIGAFQGRRDAISRELAPLSAPFDRPLAYAEDQVSQKLDQAVRAAMTSKRVTVLVRPEALLFALPTANITRDITAQLDALVKTVSITPPAGWQPGQSGQAPAPRTPSAGQGR